MIIFDINKLFLVVLSSESWKNLCIFCTSYTIIILRFQIDLNSYTLYLLSMHSSIITMPYCWQENSWKNARKDSFSAHKMVMKFNLQIKDSFHIWHSAILYMCKYMENEIFQSTTQEIFLPYNSSYMLFWESLKGFASNFNTLNIWFSIASMWGSQNFHTLKHKFIWYFRL